MRLENERLWIWSPIGLSVNLNTATFTDLLALPGMSPKCAATLADYRKLQGGWTQYREMYVKEDGTL